MKKKIICWIILRLFGWKRIIKDGQKLWKKQISERACRVGGTDYAMKHLIEPEQKLESL